MSKLFEDKDTVRTDEYEGNPMLQFGEGGDRWPFQFGRAKARKLLSAIQEMGAKEFLEELAQFCSQE